MYLESFGKFEVKGVPTNIVTDDQYIIKLIDDLKSDISELKNNFSQNTGSSDKSFNSKKYLKFEELSRFYNRYNNLYGSNGNFEDFYIWLNSRAQEVGFIVPPFERVKEFLFKAGQISN